MKYIAAILSLFTVSVAVAQQVMNVANDNTSTVGNSLLLMGQGYPVIPTKYVKVVDGSPYFRDEWMRGKLVTDGIKMYDSLRLRIDLLENELQFINSRGEQLIATNPVRGVTLIDSVTGKQYHFVHSSYMEFSKDIEKGWYQVLVSGPATLYKRTVKVLNEIKPYGSATTEQSIKTSEQYFIFAYNEFTRVKKLKDVPGLLKDKKEELNNYVKELSGKSESDFYNTVYFYNKLFEK
jgi:hypothetical protein